MIRLLNNKQMRQADAYTINELGVTARTLMQRAGKGVADEVLKIAQRTGAENITVVCGRGNNGGDGYICARELKNVGKAVKVYEFEGRRSPECVRAKSGYDGEYTQTIEGDIIVDCIFGTGLSEPVKDEYAEVIEKINSSGAFVVAVDIPSGLSGDNGMIMGVAVNADLTVAIGEYKLGHFLADGLDCCGEVVKCDIGITPPQKGFIEVFEAGDIKPLFEKRKRNSHKGTYGSANIVAGTEKYIGAAALATEAALKSGCGYVKLTTEEKVKYALAPKLSQAIYLDEIDLKSDSIAIGMGCGECRELYDTIVKLLREYEGTLIIDADGINVLAKYGADVLLQKNCKVILTPHMKEFSRISGISMGELRLSPFKHAKEFATKYSVVLVLKSATTIIASSYQLFLNLTGNTALAKAGSGDMLAGFMCGCAARGLRPINAAICASYIFGRTAEICSEEKTEYCVTARDIIKNLHLAVKELTDKS